ncbi:MAG: DUF4870 domain-containing protein [Chitinophagaceae bacterium]
MEILWHVLTFVAGFIALLIIYLLVKYKSAFVREHAKESLNFQISIFIYAIMYAAFIFTYFIGILSFVTVIVGTIKASEGKPYRYPLCIRIIQ